VLSANADGYTCGARADWMRQQNIDDAECTVSEVVDYVAHNSTMAAGVIDAATAARATRF
jgi:hypothetical protein